MVELVCSLLDSIHFSSVEFWPFVVQLDPVVPTHASNAHSYEIIVFEGSVRKRFGMSDTPVGVRSWHRSDKGMGYPGAPLSLRIGGDSKGRLLVHGCNGAGTLPLLGPVVTSFRHHQVVNTKEQ